MKTRVCSYYKPLLLDRPAEVSPPRSHSLVGTWRFGNTREDFGDFETSLRTEFEMLFGGFPEGWGDDPALQRELQVVDGDASSIV